MTRGRSAITGRFAPSPTGDLHFGSLVAALGSALSARSQGGRWLVRVEDIDPPREVEGSAERIIADLARFGLVADEPVLFQSTRATAYDNAIERLLREGKAFECGCSRADLPDNGVYPGTCRNGIARGKTARAIRARVDATPVTFTDAVHGVITEQLQHDCGDFVIRRADGLPAYQLAVVVDDAFQGVTEVVRGADLLDSTARQVHLQSLLGLPHPAYMHLPLVCDADGRKLSKQDGDDPVKTLEPALAIARALQVLGQQARPDLGVEGQIAAATANWTPGTVPRKVSAQWRARADAAGAA
ncbi:tRNA glutamyl-Q(34) synthetase GluQRS [Marinihelvus fidelis]|uniref:tRNA glutamyl-Q(34) synthetase GluQRS n=1 Tax=Marinihelvus fidelis TaxID=2613842 RepID=UPI001CD66BF3|nr:tRNA glutamyl-Q(34) synthetase GluQRS [Marinihelvus fidelis]